MGPKPLNTTTDKQQQLIIIEKKFLIGSHNSRMDPIKIFFFCSLLLSLTE